MTDEDAMIAHLALRIHEAGLDGPPEAIGIGDDAAVLRLAGSLVTSVDVVVEGIHADFSLTGVDDFGWRAASAALSDLAGMGVSPVGMLLSVVTPNLDELDVLYDGVIAAALQAACPILGGDLSRGAIWSVSVTVFGDDQGRGFVTRSGAQQGNALYVTGPLGASAAGLRFLRSGAELTNEQIGVAIAAHARPVPRLAEGMAARSVGVTAMCDLSDGLGIDLDRLARSSKVGIRLTTVPVAPLATETEALGGGDDYELLIATDAPEALELEFSRLGLRAPIRIGTCSDQVEERLLRGQTFEASGWRH
ncbi:MAG: thiamine-phosphate kinase [Actinomycetota bacterium]